MHIVQLLPELASLPNFRSVSPESGSEPTGYTTLAEWTMHDGTGWAIGGTIDGYELSVDGCPSVPVILDADLDDLILAIRTACNVGDTVIAASDGPVAWMGIVLIPNVGYRRVAWFAGSDDSDDGPFEALVSAAKMALGDGCNAIAADAWCIGDAVTA